MNDEKYFNDKEFIIGYEEFLKELERLEELKERERESENYERCK